ncbi:MAG TPA: class I SAM-dependent methyltransferase [Hyphomicrobiaceae bacterium]|nr:class I SAM-dependent methyltransferase [Hyphomicrobiaceae bacterium]
MPLLRNPVAMARQLTQSAARIAWYAGVARFADRTVKRPPSEDLRAPSRAVPARAELLQAIRELALRDARAVGDGLYPMHEGGGTGLAEYAGRIRAMLRDMPEAAGRRASRQTESAKVVAGSETLPGYYTQDFHFQDGGHLSPESARLYDVQVETLFMGSGQLMRRASLGPVSRYLRQHDQRHASLLDIACGTGRLLRELGLAFPRLSLGGIDLSPAYLAEARRYLGSISRRVRLVEGNAEALPFSEDSQDIVTSVFLYHELPPEVRVRVTSEAARVLKPGGIFVLMDSLQYGDRPGWDGLLEVFPERFHEPYFGHYVEDELGALLARAGLIVEEVELAFMSKVVVGRKPDG